MLLLPLLMALLGCASASPPQQQPLALTDDASSLTVPATGPASNLAPLPPVADGGRGETDCCVLDAVCRGFDTVVEGAVHASAGGLTSLYLCRRASGRDCNLVGGFSAGLAASLFFLLNRAVAAAAAGGSSLLSGLAWPSVDDVAFFASASSLAYLLYLSVWPGLTARRTHAWLSFTLFQALMLLYRGFRDGLASGEQTRLLLLGGGQIVVCLFAFLFSALLPTAP